MATPQSNVGELVDVRPSWLALAPSQRTILLRAEQVEISAWLSPQVKKSLSTRPKAKSWCSAWKGG